MTKTKLETEITNVLCQLAVLRIIENATPIVIPCSTEIMVIWPGPGFGTMEGESSGRVTAFLRCTTTSMSTRLISTGADARLTSMIIFSTWS